MLIAIFPCITHLFCIARNMHILQNDMHVKYRQNNLHRMTWYTGTCGSNGHGLTIHVSFMVKSVLYGALDPLIS